MTAIPYNDTDEQDDLYEHYRIEADRGQSPLRIDKFLMNRLEKVSRNRIQSAIKAGLVLVDNQTVKPNYKIKPGEVISIVLPNPPKEEDGVQAENIPLQIVFEDEYILIVDKEPGMVVHPGISNYSGTLVNALAFHLNNQNLPVQKGNPPSRPGLVHRIDKDTSGLLVIAKTEDAMTQLAKQFFEHTIEREYVALVWGTPDMEKGTVDGYIGRHPKDRMRMAVLVDESVGKPAVTHYEIIEDLYYVSLINCWLETGRTHQIRVHMSYLGHPVFNDVRYGGNRIVKGTVFTKYKQFVENNFKIMPRQALHAKSLGFTHPVSGQRVYFDSKLPSDFQNVVERWRKYLEYRKGDT